MNSNDEMFRFAKAANGWLVWYSGLTPPGTHVHISTATNPGSTCQRIRVTLRADGTSRRRLPALQLWQSPPLENARLDSAGQDLRGLGPRLFEGLVRGWFSKATLATITHLRGNGWTAMPIDKVQLEAMSNRRETEFHEAELKAKASSAGLVPFLFFLETPGSETPSAMAVFVGPGKMLPPLKHSAQPIATSESLRAQSFAEPLLVIPPDAEPTYAVITKEMFETWGKKLGAGIQLLVDRNVLDPELRRQVKQVIKEALKSPDGVKPDWKRLLQCEKSLMEKKLPQFLRVADRLRRRARGD